jgi:hypothetical protein
VAIPHDDGKSGPHQSLFREYGMANPVSAYVKKVFDTMPPRPVPEDLTLFCGLGVFGRTHMVNDHLDPGSIKDLIHAFCNKIVDGNGGGDFMAEHPIQFKYPRIAKGPIHQMGIKNFFR